MKVLKNPRARILDNIDKPVRPVAEGKGTKQVVVPQPIEKVYADSIKKLKKTVKPAKTTTNEQPKARKTTTTRKTKDTPKWVEEAEKQLEEQPLHGKVGHIMKGDTLAIVAELSEFKGTLRLDLREHQQSPEYTGPTKRGINIDTELFMDLYDLMTKVKDRLEMHGQLQD